MTSKLSLWLSLCLIFALACNKSPADSDSLENIHPSTDETPHSHTGLPDPAQIFTRFQGAPRVFVGTVRSVTPYAGTNEYGDNLIMRRIEINVEETIRGQSARTVTFELEGGELGDRGVAVSDQPELYPGDRGLFGLRLRRDRKGSVPWGRSLGLLLIPKTLTAQKLRSAVEVGQ